MSDGAAAGALTAQATARRAVVRGTMAVIVSACGFGSISPLSVVATSHGLSLPAVQTWRYTTTAVILLLWALMRRERPSPGVVPWYSPRVLLLAGGGQAAVATLALAALRWLPAATSAFLFYTYPAWVAILMAVRGVEPLDRQRVAALLLAFVGLAIMVGAPDAASLDPIGVAVILAGAVVYALYIPILARLQRGRSSSDLTRAIAVGGALIFSTWGVASGTLSLSADPIGITAGIMQGLVSVVAFWGFLSGLAVLGPVKTAITSTVEPFWTTLLGVAMLGQGLGWSTLAGGVAIMGAVVLLQWRFAPRPTVAAH